MLKKIFYSLMVATMLWATSCTDEPMIDGGEEATVSFTIGTPEIATRAYSDGLTATQLQYAVYDADGNYLSDLTGTTTINGSARIQLQLKNNKTYNLVFWAAAENSPYTINFNTKTMTVDYVGAVSNDENRDAFYKCENVTVRGNASVNVTLTRPFAQLNIGTNDYEAAEAAGYVPEYSKVTVPAYSTMNLLNGSVSEQQTVMFDYAEIPTGEIFPIENSDYEYLAMNYILVGAEQELVDVIFEHKNNVEGDSRTVGSVPVCRNHRTNLYGSLLTSNAEVNVSIEKDYEEPDNNVSVWDGVSMEVPTIENGQYQIETAANLAWLAAAVNGTLPQTRSEEDSFVGKTFVLTSDINLNGHEWTPISMSTDLANKKNFRGTFDGQGHTIYGMTVNQKEVAGLFGYVYAATIKNVTIDGATLNSNHYAGGIVAWVLNSRGNIQVPMVIENCHVKNSTITSTPIQINGEWDNGDKVGGLVGYVDFGDTQNDGAVIKGCSVKNTKVKAYRDFAGLLGYAKGVAIENYIVENVTLEQDLTHDYKAPNTPTTFGLTIGRNEGGNTIDGNSYYADGVAQDQEGNFYISNANGLKWVANEVNKYSNYEYPLKDVVVYLENDIDLGGMEWTPIGDYRFSANRFCGTFDGQGKTISNFKITKKTDKNDSGKSSYGFFGNLEGTVKNLTIAKATVNSYAYTAVLVGRFNSGLIENCHVTDCAVSNTYWQGGILIGQQNSSIVSTVVRGCTVSNSSITSKSAVGAICGPVTIEKGGTALFENCQVKNCQVIQKNSFGGSYDNYFGSMFGYIETDANSRVDVNKCTIENTTVKEDVNAKISGDIEGEVYINGKKAIFDASGLTAAIKAGGEYVLANDIAMTEAIYQNVDFTLDGNGFTISQVVGSTNNNALFDSMTGKFTFKNVRFVGVNGGAVVRTIGAEANFENITIEGANTTQQQGLLRLIGKSTIKNSIFKNNTCSMVITLNYDGANNDPQVVENCMFENNTCNATAVLYYVKGAGATINGNKFIGNIVNCDSNGATVYMGFTENNVVTNNLFKNNTVNEAKESSRVAGGVFFGYETVFTGNAFIGNKVTGKNAKGNDVCVSTYYTSINLSGNYWGGKAPVENTNYFVQHKSEERPVVINDYLTRNPIK